MNDKAKAVLWIGLFMIIGTVVRYWPVLKAELFMRPVSAPAAQCSGGICVLPGHKRPPPIFSPKGRFPL